MLSDGLFRFDTARLKVPPARYEGSSVVVEPLDEHVGGVGAKAEKGLENPIRIERPVYDLINLES